MDSSTSAAAATRAAPLLDEDLQVDGRPMFDQRQGLWCCLLCERQFKSKEHIARHAARSELHRSNLASAEATSRVSKRPAAEGVTKDAKHPRLGAPRQHPSSARADGDAGSSSSRTERSSGNTAAAHSTQGLSALEQMELFQRRLQTQEKLKPTTEEDPTIASIREAREINQQTDWECGGCKQFNFARSLVCYICGRPVDEETKYLPFGSRVRNLERMSASRLAAPGSDSR